MKHTPSDHGLILNVPDNDPRSPDRHYVLGGYSGIKNRPILMPGGHGWAKYKSVPEIQNKNGLETMNCTNYGSLNALETLARFKGYDDFPSDCSERYSGVGTGTTQNGNDPHAVIEIIRARIGVIPESFLPFSNLITTWAQYYSPIPMLKDWLDMGKVILEKFLIGHEWVIFPGSTISIAGKQERIKDALQFGPVCVSVYAWKLNDDGFYFKERGDFDNHWLQLLDFVEGEYWLVNDHYGYFGDDTQTEKKLAWDFNFNAAKIYYLERKAATAKPTFAWYVWSILLDRVRRGFTAVIGAVIGAWKGS